MKPNFPEKKVQEIRELFFPLVGETPDQRIVTGINIYDIRKIKKSNATFQVNYLHSNLGRKKSKKEGHKKEFEKFLSEYSLVHLIEKIDENLVARHADYLTQPYWDDPENVRYFTTNAKEISRSDIFDYDGTIIAESKQYDLLISIENRKDLRKFLRMLRTHFYLNEIDSYGKYILDKIGEKIPNKRAIEHDPWDIPLITIDHQKGRLVRGFKKIKKIELRKTQTKDLWDKVMLISSLVDKKYRKFITELRQNKQKYSMNISTVPKLVNKLFIEEYINK